MSDLILDAGVVVEACGTNELDSNVLRLLDHATKRGWHIWIYTGQMEEILQTLMLQIGKSRESYEYTTVRAKAQKQLLDFSEKYQWLSTLAEDAKGLAEDDLIGKALFQAATRLGKATMVVSRVSFRIQMGWPFVDFDMAFEQVTQQNVQYIDLKRQQNRIRDQLEHNIHHVLNHGRYISGPEVSQLESRLADYVGTNYCVSLSSGTDALMVAMMACGVGQQDEVVTSPFTFFSTVEMIRLLGAKPVYVDINQKTCNLDANLLERAISSRTRAILPVSLYGQCADMDHINCIANQHGLAVIEDAAQSFGALYKGKRSCGLSTIGCTSFFPSKPLGAYGDAGACFTNDVSTANIMREIANHGQKKNYDHVRIGINGRMDTLQAAVLLSKLDILDDEIKKRNEIADSYRELLKEAEQSWSLKLPEVESYNISAWAQYTIRVPSRDKVQLRLASAGIPSSVHYPIPLYLQPALFDSSIDCPEAELAAREVISIPVHPYLNASVQEQLTKTLVEVISDVCE